MATLLAIPVREGGEFGLTQDSLSNGCVGRNSLWDSVFRADDRPRRSAAATLLREGLQLKIRAVLVRGRLRAPRNAGAFSWLLNWLDGLKIAATYHAWANGRDGRPP